VVLFIHSCLQSDCGSPVTLLVYASGAGVFYTILGVQVMYHDAASMMSGALLHAAYKLSALTRSQRGQGNSCSPWPTGVELE